MKLSKMYLSLTTVLINVSDFIKKIIAKHKTRMRALSRTVESTSLAFKTSIVSLVWNFYSFILLRIPKSRLMNNFEQELCHS